MKTFRMIGIALFAVLMSVNFASCSSDDDPTEEPEGGEVVTSGKKLVKIAGESADGDSEIYTFKYDNKGRLIEATESYEEDGYEEETDTYQFIWGDDAIKVTEKSTYSGSTYTESYTLTLKNGLVQYEDYEDDGDTGTYTYNSSNRLIKFNADGDWSCTAIWDGDKLVSITESNDDEATLTYGKSCKKGYFPFIATIMGAGECDILYMAHPEITGMRTTQCPTSITWTDRGYGETTSETSTFEYEFNKEGYISKIIGKETDSDGSTETYTYTLTWQ